MGAEQSLEQGGASGQSLAAQRATLMKRQPLVLKDEAGAEVLRLNRTHTDGSGAINYSKMSALVSAGYVITAEEKQGKLTLKASKPGSETSYSVTATAPDRVDGKRVFGGPNNWRDETGMGMSMLYNLLREVEKDTTNPALAQKISKTTTVAAKPLQMPVRPKPVEAGHVPPTPPRETPVRETPKEVERRPAPAGGNLPTRGAPKRGGFCIDPSVSTDPSCNTKK